MATFGSERAIIRATRSPHHSSRFFRSMSSRRRRTQFHKPLNLQELCKRRILRETQLLYYDNIGFNKLPRRLQLFVSKISSEYFFKPENYGWLHYLNHFTLRNIHVAECVLNKRIYTIKMISSAFTLPSATIDAWKLIRHPNIMSYIFSVRETPSWKVYHIFQGTSMSLRICDELKTCRKLVIPENLLWDLIEQVIDALIHIHHKERLVYNNFGLDHLYYSLGGEKVILENPLLHDSTEGPELGQHASHPPPRIIISDENGVVHEPSAVTTPKFVLQESERKAVQCLGHVMDQLSSPADVSNVLFGPNSGIRHEQTFSTLRAIREVHYSERLNKLIERMRTAREQVDWPSFSAIRDAVKEYRQIASMAVIERHPMTIMEYVRPEEGPVPLVRGFLSPWAETEEDDTPLM